MNVVRKGKVENAKVNSLNVSCSYQKASNAKQIVSCSLYYVIGLKLLIFWPSVLNGKIARTLFMAVRLSLLFSNICSNLIQAKDFIYRQCRLREKASTQPNQIDLNLKIITMYFRVERLAHLLPGKRFRIIK